MKDHEIKLTKGGNQGGRRTEKQFGDAPNSIRATLAFMPPEVRQKARENMLQADADHKAMEVWAASDFMSVPGSSSELD